MRANKPADGEPVHWAAGGDGHPASIAQARALARSRLHGCDARLVDDCLLIVSELVTNAIRHGGGLVRCEVAALPGRITVSVQDLSSELPTVARPSGNWLPGGYGWQLVCRLAKQVTISLLEGGGKAIHVSIAHSSPAPAGSASEQVKVPGVARQPGHAQHVAAAHTG